jgi:hypothetical protein
LFISPYICFNKIKRAFNQESSFIRINELFISYPCLFHDHYRCHYLFVLVVAEVEVEFVPVFLPVAAVHDFDKAFPLFDYFDLAFAVFPLFDYSDLASVVFPLSDYSDLEPAAFLLVDYPDSDRAFLLSCYSDQVLAVFPLFGYSD